MSLPRIFTNEPLAVDAELILDSSASAHLTKVLRLQTGDEITLFNGCGGEYISKISIADKRKTSVIPLRHVPTETKSLLDITLCQAIAKGERVDFAVQKTTELGVNSIQLLHTERCQFGLKGERATKKLTHWQKIAISACEQSGRDTIPSILPAIKLDQLFSNIEPGALIILLDTNPNTQQQLPEQILSDQKIYILVGPEGGFSPAEIELAAKQNTLGINLGKRILRTETAGMTLMSILQFKYGDFSQIS